MKTQKYEPTVIHAHNLPVEITIDDIANHRDKILSDHCGQCMNITAGVKALTWNLMCQGRKENRSQNPPRTNNGYNLNENDEEYVLRLKRLAKALAQKIAMEPELAILALQEVPLEANFRAIFLNSLKYELQENLNSQWKINSTLYKKISNKFGLLTLYNNKFLARPPAIIDPTLISRSIDQKDNILITDITLAKTSLTDVEVNIRFINGHFKTRKPDASHYTPNEISKEIKTLISSCEGQVVIAADYNQPIHLLGGDNLNRWHKKGLAYYYQSDTKHIGSKNIDGFIFHYLPECYPSRN